MKRYGMPWVLLLATAVSGVAWAQTSSETPPAPEAVTAAVDFADTAFILISSALVLLMTPALAFFYGGLSRSKSVLNTMMMSFAAMGVITLVWVAVGFSIAFGDNPMGAWFGSFHNLMLAGMDSSSTATTFDPAHLIPKYVFVMFQATFAIIAAALISGALVDRMKFGAYLAFITLWSIFVYSPRGALGLGCVGLVIPTGRTGFCRWYGGAHQRGRIGAGGGQIAQSSLANHAQWRDSAQYSVCVARCRFALVRLVWF